MEERRKKMGVRSWEFEGGKVDSEVRDQTSEIRESSEEVGKLEGVLNAAVARREANGRAFKR